ncbi:zinc dependent phospholipase C family protein [Alkaliphilus serpentinus]|uniref:Zinc dependent phospholipase C family protein n=1 Tax=Alkaliphilus serpentinus TaxID=1482731 RepID=A0A833M9S7_9FIRM|nr:zinc dependent phospholipase C family protein [Alkaliphilus serpentinus]KAB3529219.1 zinc dependent phospholipase C family protein [Alkaliphilus serpentinus]
MLPITHKIISEHVYDNVKDHLGIELNKKSLIYGSIKPDIAPRLLLLDHFKPQSFSFIMHEALELSKHSLVSNSEFLKLFSRQIGVVTHFIADFFCVPHNDRLTYENNFFSHMRYETNLHMQFRDFEEKLNIEKSHFNVDNFSVSTIQNVVDFLHNQYQLRGESTINDVKSSIYAASVVAMYIAYHATKNYSFRVA